MIPMHYVLLVFLPQAEAMHTGNSLPQSVSSSHSIIYNNDM